MQRITFPCRPTVRHIQALLTVVGLSCLAAANSQPATSSVPPVTTVSPAIAKKLQGIVDSARDDALPGGIILRVQSLKTGAVWEGTSGPFAEEDEQTPIRATDAFRVASITKAFTAAVVWRMSEDKKLRPNDLMSQYLQPEITSHIAVLDGVSYGESISIAELLCHCSGIWDYAVENKNMMRYIFAHPNRQWEPPELIDIAIKQGRPYFRPGEGCHYSDTNYILLGQIIEKVTGKPLTQVYREQIYEPLNLRDTYLEGRESAVGGPRSHNYVGYLDETTFNPTMDAYASGGQVSTARDLARFITAVVTGHFFKSADTLKAAMGKPELKPGVSNPPPDGEERWTPTYLFYHSESDGVSFLGHAGFWGGVMFYQPDRKLIITGTGNQVERHLPLAAIARAFDGN